MSEFIGYVGILHEIDPEKSTVALENVKSYGTEGRRPGEEIPPSDSVYEYIVFRGSDVKDLRINQAPKDEPPHPHMPNDPAIVSNARPGPPKGAQQAFQQGPPPNQPPFQQHSGFPPQGQFPPDQRFGPGYQAPPPHYPPFQDYGVPPPGYYPHPRAVLAQQGYPPRGPPSQPPPAEKLVQQGPTAPVEASRQPPQSQTNNARPTQQRPPQDPPQAELDVAGATSQPPKQAEKPKAAPGKVALPYAAAAAAKAAPAPVSEPAKPQTGGTANAAWQQQNATRAAAAAVAAAMAKLPPGPSSTNTGEAIQGLAQKIGQLSTDDRRERGGYRGRGAPRRGGKGIEVPKSDFDFERANAKFNKGDLVKEAIASGEPSATPEDGQNGSNPLNGDGAKDEDGDIHIPQVPMYSKSSFFDNISSEIKDRQEAEVGGGSSRGGRGGHEFRTEERRRNLETFGLGSVDGGYGRGGQRGRGRGRGTFRGGNGARGGERGGERGGRGGPRGGPQGSGIQA